MRYIERDVRSTNILSATGQRVVYGERHSVAVLPACVPTHRSVENAFFIYGFPHSVGMHLSVESKLSHWLGISVFTENQGSNVPRNEKILIDFYF